MATMYLTPTPVLQFFDGNGAPLVGGQLFSYQAGTTTKQAAFTDASGTTELPNPVILNERGEVAAAALGTSCGFWLDPTLAYKLVLAAPTQTDPPTSSIWSIDDIVSADAAVLAALAQYEATIGGVPIGAQMSYGGTTAPSGWLLCYGQAVSRTTYALLFAVIGIAYGAGDSSTTFNVPDKRGRTSVGKDNMGGSAANRITNAVCGIPGTTLGAAGGDQHTAADTLTANSSAVSAVTDDGHSHTKQMQGDGGGASDDRPTSIGGANTTTMTTDTGYTGIAVATTVTTTVSGTFTGTAQNVQPSQIDNWIVFAGV